jgi:hypothetical protein
MGLTKLSGSSADEAAQENNYKDIEDMKHKLQCGKGEYNTFVNSETGEIVLKPINESSGSVVYTEMYTKLRY